MKQSPWHRLPGALLFPFPRWRHDDYSPPAIAPYCQRYPEMLAGRAVVERRGVKKQVVFMRLPVFCGEAVKHMLLRNNTWAASPAGYESSVRGHVSESVNYHDALGVYPCLHTGQRCRRPVPGHSRRNPTAWRVRNGARHAKLYRPVRCRMLSEGGHWLSAASGVQGLS